MNPRPARRVSDWTVGITIVVWLAITAIPGLLMIDHATKGPSRTPGAVVGLLVIGLGLALAAALYRQYFLGEPHGEISAEGVTIGRRTIPWAEIRDIQARSLVGIPYVGVFVSKAATRRFPLRERLDWVAFGNGTRMVELTEAQLGLSVERAVQQAEAARRRSNPREVG